MQRKYRLKDSLLQKRLEDISSDFSDFLNMQYPNWLKAKALKPRDPVTIFFGLRDFDGSPEFMTNFRFTAKFDHDEIEEIANFDPDGWNNFPDRTPPEDVALQVEFWGETYPADIFRECAHFVNGRWFRDNGRPLGDYTVQRFKIWK